VDEVELAMQRRQRVTDGLGLFADIAIARDADAVTSHAGVDFIQPRRGTQAATLLAVYKAYGPLTDKEAGERSGIPSSWKRSADLRRAGLIKPTGELRGTPKAMVCEAVP